jgi:hypothetical protein
LIVCHLVNEIERFDRIYNLKNGYLDWESAESSQALPWSCEC